MQFANKLIRGGAITGAEAEALDKLALQEVDEAVTFADQSPFPALDSCTTTSTCSATSCAAGTRSTRARPRHPARREHRRRRELQRLAEASAAPHRRLPSLTSRS